MSEKLHIGNHGLKWNEEGANYATCLGSSWLPAELGKCPNTKKHCAVLSVPVGAEIIYSPNAAGSAIVEGTTAFLQCKFNQYIIGASTTWCSNGRWAVKLGTCSSNPLGMSCYAMPTPSAGVLSYSDGAGFGFIPNATTVVLKCTDGKNLIGVGSSTCISGEWTPPVIGTCVDFTNSSYCHPQIEPAGGMVTLSKGLVELPVQNGVIARLTCSPGKHVVGSATAICSNGHWIPSSLGLCNDNKDGKESNCGWITAPVGMYITWSKSSLGGSFPNGTSAIATCINPAIMTGPNKLTCVNGMWQPPSFGICVGYQGKNAGASCIPQKAAANMELIYRAGDHYWIGAVSHNLFHGTLLTVKCLKGTLNGTGTASCADGSWYPPLNADCV